MANSRSARKRIRVNQRKHQRNLMYRSRVKTMLKKAEMAIYDAESEEEQQEAIRQAVRTLDKAAGKGILHRNNVARRKSRLFKKFHQERELATA